MDVNDSARVYLCGIWGVGGGGGVSPISIKSEFPKSN